MRRPSGVASTRGCSSSTRSRPSSGCCRRCSPSLSRARTPPATSRGSSTRCRSSSPSVCCAGSRRATGSTAAQLDKVRTVDLTARVYHRVLGLAKVEISTGGGQRDRLVLDSLRVDEGRRLRAELLHRVDPAITGMPPPTGAPVAGSDAAMRQDVGEEVLLRLDPSWIRYAPLTTTGLATAAAALGFLTQGFTR